MTTVEYLGQIDKLSKIISNKIYELREIRETMLGISSPGFSERVDFSPEFDKIGASVVKLEKKANELDKAANDFILMREHIIGQLEAMENIDHYNMLFSRFVKKKSFEQLGIEACRSKTQTYRVFNAALNDFERLYGDEYIGKSQ